MRSKASNLVSNDTNGTSDVFVHDLQTGETILVSIASDGTQGNNSSSSPSISADGRYIAFDSSSNNLVNDDTNNQPDIFMHDIQTGETVRISVASDGSQAKGIEGSYAPSISSDGHYVAFYSLASNLVNGDTNDTGDVFVRDLQGCSDKPDKPMLTKPNKGAVVATSKVPLDWQITNCTATYTVILREGSKTGPKIQTQKNLTVSQFKTKKLTSGKTYFWSVTATNNIGSSKSKWRSFTVK
jgi:predicted RNA-binding protein with TRAM domain